MAQVDRGGTSTSPPSPPPVFRWRGGWVTERLYGINDVLRYEGASYITILDHQSTDFFTDLATQKIELMADKGLAGDGSGDMLGANNLAEIVSPSAARNNIGAASAATLATLDANKLAISSKASQAQAEGGTDNANYMTALRTKQAIEEVLTTIVDVTTASPDRTLAINETVYLDVVAQSLVPLNVACGTDEIYEVIGFGTHTTGGDGHTLFRPNNASDTLNHIIRANYSANTLSAGSAATVNTVGLNIGYGNLQSLNMLISTRTLAKRLQCSSVGNNATNYATLMGIVWNDTTTVWSSLGTLSFPSAWTGMVTVRRIK
jgi:hypothetical protein